MTQPKISKKFVSLVILGVGILFLSIHMVRSAAMYVQGAFIPVEHPIRFESPVYAELLRKYVKNGLVDYTHLHDSPELSKAIEQIKRTSPDHIVSDVERLAFWINTYNLLTLEAICQHYPGIRSVQALGNFHSGKQFIVGGKPYNLQEIYDGEITPLARKIDVKTIFLVCDGCIGSPALSEYPPTKATIRQDAEAAVYKFVNDPENVVYDADHKKFSISPFFQWHHELFETTFPSPHHFVNNYLEPARQIDCDDVTIMKSYLPAFNWQLNDLALAPQTTNQ